MSHGDPFKALESSLAITPSPEFSARVRTRIAQTPQRTPGARPRTWMSVAALVVLGLGAGVVHQIAPVTLPRPVPVAAPAPEVPILADRAPSADQVALAPIDESRATPVVNEPRMVRASALPRTEVDASFTEVLVPPDQAIALARLLRGIRAGRTTVPARATADTEIDADGHVVPRALLIDLLDIAPIPGTPGITSKGARK